MKKVPPASAATERAYAAIGAALADDGVESGAMFGMPALKQGGRACAGLFGDSLVFKLSGDTHAEALGLEGAELFDPSGTGRAMKAWVVVPRAHQKHWSRFAAAALTNEPASHTSAKKPTAKKPTEKQTVAKKQ